MVDTLALRQQHERVKQLEDGITWLVDREDYRLSFS